MHAFTSDAVPRSPASATPAAPLPAFLRLRDVVRITGLSRSTIYRLMAENRFPAPCRLGRCAVGWRSEDIARWLEPRQTTRR